MQELDIILLLEGQLHTTLSFLPPFMFHIYIKYICINKKNNEIISSEGGKQLKKNKTARALSSGTYQARTPESIKTGIKIYSKGTGWKKKQKTNN